MKILFLGYLDTPIIEELRKNGHSVVAHEERIGKSQALGFDFLVSYGYRFILPREILELFPKRAINLHISFLPWNRGSDPNFWSFVENTPKGVTIHELSEGVDDGPILLQSRVEPTESDTLSSFYDRLRMEIERLFRVHSSDLLGGRFQAVPQTHSGTTHKRADRAPHEALVAGGWNVPVQKVVAYGKSGGLNKPVQLARALIVGAGRIAGGYDENGPEDQILSHAKAFLKNPRVELCGVVDFDIQRAESFGKRWGGARAFVDLKEALAETTPDFVSICTPNPTHHSVLKTVLAARPKAILCEKPLSLDPRTAAEMVTACKDQGVILAVNYLRRWDPKIRRLLDRIHSEEFGKIRLARAIYTKGIFHNASHGVNLLQEIAGPVSETLAKGLRSWGEDGDVAGDFELRFGRGGRAHFTSVDEKEYNTFEIDLFFERGRILLSGGGFDITIWESAPSRLSPGEAILLERDHYRGSLHRAMENVVENTVAAIFDRAPLGMSPDDALTTMTTCENIRKIGS
jgi:methionyl-tRNA formyltransferase